jgi:prefoldin alpha subunit
MSDQSNNSTIQLDSMSLEELNQIQQQEQERLSALTQRLAQLRSAAGRLYQSTRAIEAVTPASEGAEALLPLTESVYVKGRIRNSQKLLVDIGTSFFAEKSSKETVAFLERKIKIVDANSENLQKAVAATRQNLEAIGVTMQGKMLEIRARQEGQKHRTAMES